MISREFLSSSISDTYHLAGQIGERLRGGEIFELISDLGGGKTAFTRGLVAVLGSSDEVSSPSFTINNTYKAGDFIIEHYDFYRISESGVVGEELAEHVGNPDTITLVEWGETVRDLLGDKSVQINIISTGEDTRRITIIVPDDFAYLLEGVSI